MAKTTAIVKAENIGLAFGDELTAGDKIRLVKEYVTKELVPYNARISELIEISKTLVITNDDERKQAASVFLEIKYQVDEAKALRAKLLAKAKKEIVSIEKPFLDLSKLQEQAEDAFEGMLKKDWLDFEDARIATQDIHNATAEKEREDGEFTPDIILAETERRINTDLGYTTIRKAKKITVVNKLDLIRAIAKNPLVYLPDFIEVDLSYVKKHLAERQMHGIPGLKIEDDAIVAGYKNKKGDK
jgi:hypothetical protein